MRHWDILDTKEHVSPEKPQTEHHGKPESNSSASFEMLRLQKVDAFNQCLYYLDRKSVV